MMGKRGIAAALCMAIALGIPLAGCSAGGDASSNYAGEWKLASSTDENLDADSIELMGSLGLEGRLTLDEDGTGTLDMFGDEDDVEWKAASSSEGTLTLNGDETAMSLADGELTLDDVDGASMTFKRS